MNRQLALPARRVGASTPILVGCAVIVGWALHIGLLKSLLPSFVAMNPASAVTFVLAGVSFWCLYLTPRRRVSRALGQTLAGMVLAVGAIKLLGAVLGWRYGIDQILFHDQLQGAFGRIPNRMAPNTALNFFLTGSVLLLSSRKDHRSICWSQARAAIMMLIALLALVGYLYGNLSVSESPHQSAWHFTPP